MIDRSVRDSFGAAVVARRYNKNAVRWVEFPSLEDAREHFFRTKGIKIQPAGSA